jgi:hypothetical protein
MIYCHSGTYFRKVLFRFRLWFWFRFQLPDPDTFFKNNKFGQNFAFSMLEAAMFPKKSAANFLFFDFCVTFYVGSGYKSGSGTETVPVPVPLRQKVAVPAVPVPSLVQPHWFEFELYEYLPCCGRQNIAEEKGIHAE